MSMAVAFAIVLDRLSLFRKKPLAPLPKAMNPPRPVVRPSALADQARAWRRARVSMAVAFAIVLDRLSLFRKKPLAPLPKAMNPPRPVVRPSALADRPSGPFSQKAVGAIAQGRLSSQPRSLPVGAGRPT